MRASRAEAEQVLKRHDRDVRDRHLDGADEVPVDLGAVGAEVAPAVVELEALGLACARARAVRVPADDRVIVVRAGIGDDVRGVLVGQMGAVGIAVPRELEHAHSGKAQLVAERVHIVRDDPQILGEDRQVAPAERLRDRTEEIAPRRRHPGAVLGRIVLRRHLPARGESAEVIESHHVHEPQRLAHPLDPPAEAVLAEMVPVVERTAPELAGGTEGIGRHAGDDGRAPVGPELPLVRVRPHVRRIVGDEDGHVADDADAPVIGIAPELEPLPEEDVLEEPVRLDAVRRGRAGPRRGRRARGGRARAPTWTSPRHRGRP